MSLFMSLRSSASTQILSSSRASTSAVGRSPVGYKQRFLPSFRCLQCNELVPIFPSTKACDTSRMFPAPPLTPTRYPPPPPSTTPIRLLVCESTGLLLYSWCSVHNTPHPSFPPPLSSPTCPCRRKKIKN